MNELEIIQHSRVSGISVFLCTVDYRTPHFHPEWELLWVLDQAMMVSISQGQVRASRGDLMLFQPGEIHEFHKIDQECTFLCLQVSPKLFHTDEDLTLDSAELNRYLSDKQSLQVRQYMCRIMENYTSSLPFSALDCIGTVCLLFGSLFRSIPVRTITREERLARDRRNKRLESLLRYVDENYMHKIRLSDYAHVEGFSLSYLSHFVKSSLNQSFQEYVNSVRVNCACKMIAAGEEKLTAVSLASGFSDYRYFSASFKKQFGMTPEQYKLSVKKPENAVIHHSIHSLERFYNDEQSRVLMEQYMKVQNIASEL